MLWLLFSNHLVREDLLGLWFSNYLVREDLPLPQLRVG